MAGTPTKRKPLAQIVPESAKLFRFSQNSTILQSKIYREAMLEFKKNKPGKFKPNLNAARPRSNSQSAESHALPTGLQASTSIEGNWIFPKNPNRRPNQQEVKQITLKNQFQPISHNDDYMELEDGHASNSQAEATQTTSQALPSNRSTDVSNTQGSQQRKSPPIHVNKLSIREISNLLESNKINKTDYYVKQLDINVHTINTLNIDIFNKVKEVLNTKKHEYYTYTPKHLKPKNLVLKGINGDYTVDEIQKEIESLKIENVAISKISKFIFNKNDPSKFHHLVQLTHGCIVPNLTKINRLAQQVVRWEPLRRKGIYQCRNCQGLMHTSANCKLPYKCVKCADNHTPGQCPIKDIVDKDKLKCVNCESVGHPASYKGCPFIKFTQELRNERKNSDRASRLAKVHRLHNEVQHGISYANMARQNANQPRNQPPTHYQTSHNIHSTFAHNTHTNNSNSQEANIADLLDSLKKDILFAFSSKLDNLTQIINSNTSRIDNLYRHLNLS